MVSELVLPDVSVATACIVLLPLPTLTLFEYGDVVSVAASCPLT